jgi:hypothetical protein
MNLQPGFSGFEYSADQRIGFSMTILADIPVAKYFSVQPEISFTQKGAKFSGSGKYYTYSSTYAVNSDVIFQLDYVNFDLLAKLTTPKGNVKPYLLAGPGAGVLATSGMRLKVDVDGEENSQTEKIQGVEKTDLHFNLGGGFDFLESVRIDVRYVVSFNSVSKDNFGNGIDMKNSYLSINFVAYY